MKKLILGCAFALFALAFTNVANAQCCGGKKSAGGCSDKAKTEVNAADNINKPDAKTTDVKTTCADKKSNKKCCSGDNANASNKKECCSSKKQARKEETK
ncbi:MAG: hypothetical protein NZ455_08530 [Bacteroidia bacterium]|nr:hypothetical protein [Bacteroidia bacterium]MDW8346999.1 hypothetical protein [Bacteroidia bacterium]